jgi:hypothetical protein
MSGKSFLERRLIKKRVKNILDGFIQHYIILIERNGVFS